MQWAAVLLMVPVFVLAHATLIFVERPARHRAARVQSRVTISARHLRPYGFALVAVAATAMAVVQGRGLPARYGGAGTDVAAAMRDASPDSITAYGAHASRCHLADKGNATWCWRTPGIGKGIAVFGDSHAEVIFAGIDAWHSTAPLFLTGRKGCAPILQQEAIADREAEICRRAANLAANAILADTSIGTVLLVSRGPAYITGTGFGVDSQRRVVPVALQRSPADSASLRRAYESGLERSVQAFSRAGKRVLLVIGVPELGFQPEECLIGRPLGLRELRAPCAIPRVRVEERNADYRALVRAIATRNPSLEVFDAQSIFCDDVLCHAEQGSRLLYQDGNHLTLLGSRLVTRRLQTVLDRTPTATRARNRGAVAQRRQVLLQAVPQTACRRSTLGASPYSHSIVAGGFELMS